MTIARGLPLLGLFACLLLGGCAAKDPAPDNDRQGGFYGGVSAGGARP